LYRTGCNDRGGEISGEGDSFDIYETDVMEYFYEVVDWVNETFGFEYDVQNFSLLRKIAWGFSKFSNNVLEGCIGAIDGIAIRIRHPYFTEVPDRASTAATRALILLRSRRCMTGLQWSHAGRAVFLLLTGDLSR